MLVASNCCLCLTCLRFIMAILKNVTRVDFDPSLPAHRQAVRKLLVRNSWNDTGFRFNLDPAYDNLIDQVTHMTLDWYASQDKEMQAITPL